MKMEEAIEWLEIMKEDAIFEQCDALKMAIDALQAKQKDEQKFYDEDDFWDDRVSIHDRLINASWVINEIHKSICDMCEQGIDIEDCNYCKIEKIKRIIYSAPTIQADQSHGEWIQKPHKVYLPRDYEPDIIDYHNRQYNEEDHSIVEYWWHCNQCDYEANRWSKPTLKFCPNCGARMKGAGHEID